MKISRMENKLGRKELAGAVDKKSNKKDTEKKGVGRNKKKIIAASIIGAGLLSVIIFIIMIFVFDLGPIREIKSSDEEARVVGEVDGFEVRYEELRYITLLYRAELDAEMGRYETLTPEKRAEYEKALEDKVSSEIKNNYAVLSLCKKYGVDTNTREMRSYVNDSIEVLVNELGGKDEYRVWLGENNLTDALMRLIYKAEYLESALLEELTKTKNEIKYSTLNLDDFVKFVMEDESYVKVIHAFYPKEHEYIDTTNMRDRAEAALLDIKKAENDGERYSCMISAIGNAPFVQGYSVTGTDYYITYAQMHDDYEAIAFSLPGYGVSEVLELDEGYYIIMRVPKVRDEVAPRAYQMIDHYRYAVLKRLEDEQKEALTFKGNDYFNALKLTEIK